MKSQRGFTLIEIIMAIVLFSFVSTMFITFHTNYISQSAVPIVRLSHAAQLQQTTQNISEYYLQDPTKDLNILKTLLSSSPEDFGGNFTVQYNNFIKFVSNNDTSISSGDPEELLKIKIEHNDTRESIVLIFAKQ